MVLKNVLLVVSNIEESKKFYSELFGLKVVMDFGENVILTEGLALQEKPLWETFIARGVRFGGNDGELYFEENNINSFLKKIDSSDFDVEFIDRCREHEWGQRVIRFYDPDRHIIEVGEDMYYVARKYLHEGMNPEQVAKKTQMPLTVIESIYEGMDK